MFFNCFFLTYKLIPNFYLNKLFKLDYLYIFKVKKNLVFFLKLNTVLYIEVNFVITLQKRVNLVIIFKKGVKD